MQHKIINSLDDITIRNFNKVIQGDMTKMLEPEIDADVLSKNNDLILQVNDAYIKLYDRFNDKIKNRNYRLNIDGTKKNILLGVQISQLQTIISMCALIVNLANTADPALIEIDKIIQDSCKFNSVKFERDYLKLTKRVNGKIGRLNSEIEINNQRMNQFNTDNASSDNSGSGIIGMIPICAKAGFTVREDDSVTLLIESYNLADKFFKSGGK